MVTELVSTLRLDRRSVLTELLPAFRELTGTPSVAAYGFEPSGEGLRVGFVHAAGFTIPTSSARQALDGAVHGQTHFGLYSPAKPEPAQRNRVVVAHTGGSRLRSILDKQPGLDRREREVRIASIERLSKFFGHLGVAGQWQLRVLICDGPALLSWFGGFQPEPFSARQLAMLRHLVAPLRQRLALELRLERAEVSYAALGAALEQLARPAFVVDQRGAVRLTNSAGRECVDRGQLQIPELLRAARASPNGESPVTFTPLAAPGLPPHYLAVFTLAATPIAARVAAASARWALTRRQRDVLEQVVRGESNKAIAATLGCAESTVEAHLTRLFEKTQTDSRSALAAKFWSERA